MPMPEVQGQAPLKERCQEVEEQCQEGIPVQEAESGQSVIAASAEGIQQEVREVLDPRRILWQPTPEQIAQSNVVAFVRFLGEQHGKEAPTLERLYEWSIDNPEEFWRSFLRFSGMIYEGDDVRVLSAHLRQGSGGQARGEGALRMIDAGWFPDVRLNFAENLLRMAVGEPEKEAIAFFAEDGRERRMTYGELQQEAVQFSRMLDACDVQQGDRVVASMPNIPETVAAMLATTARGAMWSSISPAFGADTVVQRFSQLDPKVLIAADGHLFRGKAHNALEKIRAITELIPSIERTIVVPYASDAPDISGIRNGVLYNADDYEERSSSSLSYTRLPFDHPLFILFSSGTEGLPKCIVHGAGGTLLNQLKQHLLHTNLTANDTFFFHTETSWMMWNSLVSGLGTGATIVLYDGDPFARSGRLLWDIMEKERVAVFGTGAPLLAKMEKNGVHPRTTHNLSHLRTILSTGSRLYGSQFDYVYEHVHPAVQLSSTSGGTDILGAFATASPALPVRREELQTRSLGYKVEVFDDDGHPLPPGVPGELVCTAPFPSQPVGFWNDPGHERYLAAYFQKYGPTVWHHGDTAELTPSGGMVIHGRSDDTIKAGGVRIGPAEITMQVEGIPEILASAAIGHQVGGGRIVLFVVLRKGQELTDELQARIRAQIRAGASPHHAPAVICAVPDLPRTHNGKVSLRAIRSVVHGKEVENLDSLSNPDTLAHFRDRPELRF